jgi:hypothetical protein
MFTWEKWSRGALNPKRKEEPKCCWEIYLGEMPNSIRIRLLLFSRIRDAVIENSMIE